MDFLLNINFSITYVYVYMCVYMYTYTCWAETDMKGVYAQTREFHRGIKRNPFLSGYKPPPFPPSCVTLVLVDEKLPAVAPREISDSRMEVANVINGTVN